MNRVRVSVVLMKIIPTSRGNNIHLDTRIAMFSFKMICLCFQDHCCLKELSALIKRQSSRIEDLEMEVAENSVQLNEQKTEIQILKVCAKQKKSFSRKCLQNRSLWATEGK